MIDRKIKTIKDRTQKISTFFLAILLCSQALIAIPPNAPHTDINATESQQASASIINNQQNNPTQDYKKRVKKITLITKKILKNIALGAADSLITIALLHLIKKSMNSSNTPAAILKTLACSCALLCHFIPISINRPEHRLRGTIPIELLVILPMLFFLYIPEMISKVILKNNDQKIGSRFGIRDKMLSYHSQQIDSPTSYAIGSLLTSAVSITKLGVNPLYTLPTLFLSFLHFNPNKKIFGIIHEITELIIGTLNDLKFPFL